MAKALKLRLFINSRKLDTANIKLSFQRIKKSLGRYDSIRIAAGGAKNLIKKIVGSDNRIVIFQLGNPGICLILNLNPFSGQSIKIYPIADYPVQIAAKILVAIKNNVFTQL